jgi:short-subunit dehydrogenase
MVRRMAVAFAKSWVLVTGASSGLGEEFARQLAASSANLILTARSQAPLERLSRELSRERGVEARVVIADLAEPGGAQALCRDVDALALPVEHLINNAGFGGTGPLADQDPDELGRMLRLNCEAPLTLGRHFLPAMLARGKGGILNVASTAALQPIPYMATYAATKAFVLSLTVAMAEEARDSGVHVTALCPGPVRTGFQARAGIRPERERGRQVFELSATHTVERGLRAYAAGRAVCITGAANNAQAAVAKLLPRGLAARAVGKAMKRMGRAR